MLDSGAPPTVQDTAELPSHALRANAADVLNLL